MAITLLDFPIDKNNTRTDLSHYVMLLAVFSSTHVIFVDTLGIRLALQIVMCALLLLYLSMSTHKKMDNKGFIVVLLITVCLLSELIFRQQINKIAGYFLAIPLVYVMLVMKREQIIRLIDTINKINTLFALLALVALILSFQYASVFKALLSQADYYNKTLPTGNALLALLGHADTWQSVLGIEDIPRISAHLKQASLLPAYMLLPLAISMAYSKVNYLCLSLITLFLLTTFGGVVYFSIMVAILVFIFGRFVPSKILIFFPFLFLVIFISILVSIFWDIYDLENIKDVARLIGSDLNQGDPISNRAASGASRMSLIAFAAIEMFFSFPLPAGEKILSFTLGSNIITSGLRAGIFGLCVSITMYYFLLRNISYGLVLCRSLSWSRLLGFSLLYSLVFQSITYNDFGFSTYYGFIMWTCILVLSNKSFGTLKSVKASTS